jgi:DNA replication and repair protein RecF
VQIGWLSGVDFRNYRTLSLTPAPRLNVLSGPNGQGKTSLLEALGFLVTGRSFRTPRTAEIPRWGSRSSSLSGGLLRAEATGEARRTLRRTLEQLDDVDWARAVAFGWQDLEIVNGAPAARRTFIDGFAGRLHPAHVATLIHFRRLLARRNRLLQQRTAEAATRARLEPWNEQFATAGMELVNRRRRAVAALQTELARVYAALGTPQVKLEIRYRTALGEAADAAALLTALERGEREELRRGQTLVGPHRDDLAIELDGVDARVFGSRGQQRLVALALRLAEVLPVTEAAGTAPVLLLDDALSELDPAVRERVVRELGAAEQVFLTTPEPPVVPGAAVFYVNAGGVAAG